jgi:hypothetical protein
MVIYDHIFPNVQLCACITLIHRYAHLHGLQNPVASMRHYNNQGQVWCYMDIFWASLGLIISLMLTLIAESCMGSFKLGRKSSRPLPEVFAAADSVKNSWYPSSWFLCHERWIGTWWGCAEYTDAYNTCTTQPQGVRDSIIRQPLYVSPLFSSWFPTAIITSDKYVKSHSKAPALSWKDLTLLLTSHCSTCSKLEIPALRPNIRPLVHH